MDMRKRAHKMKQSLVGKPYLAEGAGFPVSQEE
jgi:hypothetical protein